MRRGHGCTQPIVRSNGAEQPSPASEPATPGHELHRRHRHDHPAGQRHVLRRLRRTEWFRSTRPGRPAIRSLPERDAVGRIRPRRLRRFRASDRQGVRDYRFDDDRSREHSNRFDHLHRDRRPQHYVHDDGAWDSSIACGRQVRHRVRLDQFGRSRRRHPHRRQPGIVFGLHDSRLRPRAIRRRIQQYGWVRL